MTELDVEFETYGYCDECEKECYLSDSFMKSWKCLLCSTPPDSEKVLKSIVEFKKFAYFRREIIYSRKEFIRDYNWCPTNRTVIVISCDYIYEGIGNINYDYTNDKFERWLKKYNYNYDWYNPGLVTIYEKN